MVDETERVVEPSEPVEASEPSPADSGAIKYGELDPDNPDRENANRLSNVRFPVGEEPWPDVPGTDKDDPTVNVKLEVTENPDPGPNQRHLLHLGAELKMNCFKCNYPLRVAAARKAKEILVDAGYTFNPEKEYKGLNERLVVVSCENGHLVQLHEDAIERLKKND